MDPDLKAKWVAALRSGEFKQGQMRLTSKGEHCCLGVLCEVMELELLNPIFGTYRWGEDTLVETDLGLIKGNIGLPEDIHLQLMDMNDNGASFAQIADYIEEHL